MKQVIKNEVINKLIKNESNELNFEFGIKYRLDKSGWGADIIKEHEYEVWIGSKDEFFRTEESSIVIITHEWMHIFLHECFLKEGYNKKELEELEDEWIVLELTPGNSELWLKKQDESTKELERRKHERTNK